jgi:hypothetical protein
VDYQECIRLGEQGMERENHVLNISRSLLGVKDWCNALNLLRKSVGIPTSAGTSVLSENKQRTHRYSLIIVSPVPIRNHMMIQPYTCIEFRLFRTNVTQKSEDGQQ